MMFTTVILVVLVMDTYLQCRSRTLAEPVAQQYGKQLCTDEMFSLIGCKTVDLYVDGIAEFNLPNSGKCKNADKKMLTGTARGVAVKITKPDNEPGRFLASGKYFRTDDSWKCTNKHYNGWHGVNFNDFDWPRATVLGPNGMMPWGNIAGISGDAQWIWTANDVYGRNSDAVVYCRKSRDYCKCIGTGQSCVSSCPPKSKDGQYQSCKGCNCFVSCLRGKIYDDQSCKVDGLTWDDNLKKCSNETSTTCKCCTDDEAPTTAAITTRPTSKTTTTVTTQPTTLTTLIKTTAQTTNRQTTVCIINKNCITSCYGRTDGPYQSCKGCRVYAICFSGMLHDNLACNPYGTSWDDVKKKCVERSSTCKPCQNEATTAVSTAVSTVTTQPTQEATTVCNSGPPCITSCTDLVDGRYKSCKGCRFYASCSYGQFMDELPCTTDELEMYWDDGLKECTSDSAVCRSCTTEETTTAVCTSGPRCITSCDGLDDGEYQLCKSCRVYAFCSYGQRMVELPCGTEEQRLYWDDERKKCTAYSNTCHPCTNEETTTVAVTEEQTTTTSEVCPTERPYIPSPCCSKDGDRPCSNKWFFQFLCKIMSEMY